MSDGVTYRFLTLADAKSFRSLRLRSLKESPEAFLDDFEEASAWPMEWFEKRFDSSRMAGGFINSTLVGMSGLSRQQPLKIRHKGELWGVYVMPEARGYGIARRCIEMLLEAAQKDGIEQVILSTDVTNEITVALYKSLGFEPWGVEKHITKLPDRYIDDVVMTKFLK